MSTLKAYNSTTGQWEYAAIGAQGASGQAGIGIASGGTNGQFLTKVGTGIGTDYATQWTSPNYALLSGATFTGNVVANSIAANSGYITSGSSAFGSLFQGAQIVDIGQQANSISIGLSSTNISIGNNLHTGTTTIQNNLYVAGNITFGGTSTTLSATNLNVTDSLIYLSVENSADIIDIGWVGAYVSSSTHLHTGFVRDASDGKWKLFSGISAEPTTVVDFNGATYDTLKIGTLEVTDASTTRANLGLGTMALETASNYLTTSNASNTYATLSNPVFLTGISFEGTTPDTNETYLTVVDPTADRTITLPDDTGTVALTKDTAKLASANTFTVGGHIFNNDSASTIPLIVRGFGTGGSSTQSVDLQQWNTYNGTTSTNVAKITKDGVANFTGVASSGNSVFNYTTTFQNSTVIPLIAKNLGGSADLFQLQNSVATVLGGHNAAGQMYTGTSTPALTTISASYVSGATTDVVLSTSTTNHNLSVGDIVYLSGFTGSGYNNTAVVSGVSTNSTTVTVRTQGTGTISGSGIIGIPAQMTVTPRVDAFTGLAIRAKSTNQVGDLVQYQNSTGAVMGGVSASGSIFNGTSAYYYNSLNTITNIAWTSGNTATITMATTAGSEPKVNVGDVIKIQSVTGGSASLWNGTVVVTSVTSNNVFIVSAPYIGSYLTAGTAGGIQRYTTNSFIQPNSHLAALSLRSAATTTSTVSGSTFATASGNYITYTTTTAHGLLAADVVTITGITSANNLSGTAGSQFNQTNATIVRIVSTTSFVIYVAGAITDTIATSGGTATQVLNANILELSNSSGTIVHSFSAGGSYNTVGNITAGGKVTGGGMDLVYSGTFTAASSVSFNNIFSASYDNYKVIITYTTVSANANYAPFAFKFRASGSDYTVPSSYYGYYWGMFNSAMIQATQSGSTQFVIGPTSMIPGNGTVHIYEVLNPYTTQTKTLMGNNLIMGNPGGTAPISYTGQVFTSFQFDGFTIATTGTTQTIAGSIRIYGYHN